MRNLVVVSYSLTGAVYLLFVYWLVLQGKVKEPSQRYFVGWLLFLMILGINGTIFTSIRDSCTAFMLWRIQFAILILSGTALFLFSTSLRRELEERDIVYLLPALAAMSLIWTFLVTGVKETSIGWQVAFNGKWIVVFMTVLYGYYIASIFQLTMILRFLKEEGSKVAVRKTKLILYSMVFLTLASILPPFGQALGISFMPAIVNIIYTFPAGAMAYSFRLSD